MPSSLISVDSLYFHYFDLALLNVICFRQWKVKKQDVSNNSKVFTQLGLQFCFPVCIKHLIIGGKQQKQIFSVMPNLENSLLVNQYICELNKRFYYCIKNDTAYKTSFTFPHYHKECLSAFSLQIKEEQLIMKISLHMLSGNSAQFTSSAKFSLLRKDRICSN